jgi:hypothetical protein
VKCGIAAVASPYAVHPTNLVAHTIYHKKLINCQGAQSIYERSKASGQAGKKKGVLGKKKTDLAGSENIFLPG